MKKCLPILCLLIVGCTQEKNKEQSQHKDKEKSSGLEHTGVKDSKIRPQVTFVQQGGKFKYYQIIDLEHSDYHFMESSNLTWCTSDLWATRTHITSSNTLSKFSFTLRSEPERIVSTQGTNRVLRSIDAVVVSRFTEYEDIDGDSCFDTMVKCNCPDAGQYILYSNLWIQVRVTPEVWMNRSQVKAIDSSGSFDFKNGRWVKRE